MTKVRFHGPVAGFSGAMGEMVFADHGKRTVVYMKTHYAPSDAQVLQQERFAEAAAYAKSALADPARREFYETMAQVKDIPAFSLAVADYLNLPYFHRLDLSQYKGRVGDPILIVAVDDLGLVSVDVELAAIDGRIIEKGKAMEAGLRSGNWTYTATTPVALGSDIFIEVNGLDHAGKNAVISANPIVGSEE